MPARNVIENIFADVDIAVNGNRAWDVQVRDERFFARVFSHGSLGLGESYMLAWWDCADLFGFFNRLLSHDDLTGRRYVGWRTAIGYIRAKLSNIHTPEQSRQMADTHYNLSNHLFEHMIGPSMAYSCAYWKDAKTLDAAQYAKFDLVCRKLKLKKGDRLLDIGCGWGGLMKFAIENHGVEATGLTISKAQAAYARDWLKGLPATIILCDYREFDASAHGGPFDTAASVGMMEHVGYRNYRALFECACDSLRDQGLFLLHTIGNTETKPSGDPWIGKYIFPEGMLPSMVQLSEASEMLMNLHDLQNIGTHYTKTLLAWEKNFDAYWTRDDAVRPRIWGSEDTFRRMWRYYLEACAASFNTGEIQVWQQVYAKGHLPDGYTAER